MRVQLACGLTHLNVEVADHRHVPLRRQPLAEPLSDPAAAVRDALEHPFEFPALRQALTPDDHVAIFVDEGLPRLAELLTPVLEHLRGAGISSSAVTLLCSPPSSGQAWAEQLPEEFQDVQIEVHDPTERRKLSYLATTRAGRRIYLNRTAVDADQLILLTGRWYDAVLGFGGAETSLFPTLADEATVAETAEHLSIAPPGKERCPMRQEAVEVAWLLGAPFLIQVIQGCQDQVTHVVAGPVASSAEGRRLHETRWNVEVAKPADLVIAGIGGDPQRHSFLDLARAFLNASRIVAPGGSIILVTEAQPTLGPSAEILRGADEPAAALRRLRQEKPADIEAGFAWASAAQLAKLYLLSRLPADVVEEMFATPLETAGQVQRLVTGAASCVFLPEAHRTLAVIQPADESREPAA